MTARRWRWASYGLALVCALLWVRGCRADAAARAEKERGDRYAAEAAMYFTDALGYKAALEAAETDLARVRAEMGDSAAMLVERLAALGARNAVVARVEATATDTLTGETSIDTTEAVVPAWSDSVAARFLADAVPVPVLRIPFRDRIFAGVAVVRFNPPVLAHPDTRVNLLLPIRAVVPFDYLVSEQADGSWLIASRSRSERVRLAGRVLAWEPPAVDDDGGIPWGWVGGTAAVTLVVWEWLR